jgi:hypothetical protein
MRYNNLDLLTLLGGHAMTMQKIFDMSPTIQKLKADAAREATFTATVENSRAIILRRLTKRFGPVSNELSERLRSIQDLQKLETLVDVAYDCTDLDTFRASLTATI